MPAEESPRPTYRVIAEGDDAVATGLSIHEALAVMEFARGHGQRLVAIVNDETGAMIDEFEAKKLSEQGGQKVPGVEISVSIPPPSRR